MWLPEKFVVHVLSAHLSAATKLPSLCPKVSCASMAHQSAAWDRHSKVQRSAKYGPTQKGVVAIKVILRSAVSSASGKVAEAQLHCIRHHLLLGKVTAAPASGKVDTRLSHLDLKAC